MFPVCNEGFSCGGEMLSFGILSNAIMVMVISSVQFTHVFLLLFKEKLLKCCDTWHLVKSALRCLVWFERAVKVFSGALRFSHRCLLYLSLFSYRNQDKNAVFYWPL